MLLRLQIKNFALIESADITFNEAFNVLSGETGSGKSIILDSVNFVLGAKADKSLIRYGTDETVVKAEFSVESNSMACKALNDLDIECDGTIIISRKYTQDGKGSIKINGNSVTAAMLKSVTAHLVDVYGQSEHFFLLNEDNQLSTIDLLCREAVIPYKEKLSELINKREQCLKEIGSLGGDEGERARTIDLLSYQIYEISASDFTLGEFDKLKERKKLIDNSEKIISSLAAVKSVLSDDNGCNDLLSIAIKQFYGITDISEEYSDIYSRLDNVSVEIQDLGDTVSDLLDEFSFDEDEAKYVDERLTLLKGIMKKYGPGEQDVLNFLENAINRRKLLENAADAVNSLNKQVADCNKNIFAICKELTNIRKAKCVELSKSIESELKQLNIPNARFEVNFVDYNSETANLNSKNGSDKISFMFSANKGEPLKPLNKVISGGEMSRFLLAVKTQLKDLNGISTYIFDEIDSGISGITARTVAEKFISISKDTQIIVVSHLPQVCAAATQEYLIFKTTSGNKTVTNVKCLDRDERKAELVRLTGGTNTNAAEQHADELLKSFGN